MIDRMEILIVSFLCDFNSVTEEIPDPIPVNTSEAVFVTFAFTGGNPKLNNTGYDIKEAKPAMELSNPEAIPAINR